ncbi:hypothetical protein [Nostoc sp. UHCC 0870]|uniref:hypothetical protein n=1 Tax=Nostoc sp. UHCC 0870 TaxID=2914041 RepID=UPI001EDDE44E|nr:hypothetical protein [Nostoc sp. UHCC 0870]UKP00516.1 hypothetical protein L6494_12770 [Nostoc sp. UHCC 0870]
MTELIQSLIRPLWQFLMPVPMPWRSAIIVLLLIPILSWLFLRAFPWLIAQLSQIMLIIKLPKFVLQMVQIFGSILLLPEYLITKFIRQRAFQIPFFIYIFDDVIIATVSFAAQACEVLDKILQKSTKIAIYAFKIRWFSSQVLLLIPSSLILIWYLRPQIDENEATKLIDSGVISWYSLENWAIDNNESILLNSSAPRMFISEYFAVINRQQYTIAWNSLSDEYKNKVGNYRNFLDWWESKVEKVEVYGVRLKSHKSQSAIIDVSMQYLMRTTKNKPETEVVRYQLVWDTQGNRWLINDSE